MKQCIAIAITFGIIASANAGLVMKKNNQVTFGKVSDKGDKVAVEVSVGNTVAKKYPVKASLKWWTFKEEVTNYFTAAKAALEAKEYDIAKTLIGESIQREPTTKAEAQALRTKIREAASGAPPKETKAEGDKDDKGDKAKEPEVKMTKVGGGTKLYDALKDHLLDPKTGKKFDGKTWGKADYYLLCFVSLKFPGNRDILRRLIGRHDMIQSDLKGKLQCLFYPIDRDAGVLAAQVPKMDFPFPILKSKIAAKTSLIKHKTSSCSFAIVDAAGNLVKKGDKPLRMVIDLQYKLDE